MDGFESSIPNLISKIRIILKDPDYQFEYEESEDEEVEIEINDSSVLDGCKL